MARGRTALTDKEERILVQAQLMGMSTSSMIKIGNRLKALEKERDDIAKVNDTTQGFSWESTQSTEKLTVVTPKGYTVKAVRGKRGNSRWYHSSWEYDVTVSKPGTRFKERFIPKVELTIDHDWRKRIMPANSKELYSLIRWCRSNYEIDLA